MKPDTDLMRKASLVLAKARKTVTRKGRTSHGSFTPWSLFQPPVWGPWESRRMAFSSMTL